MDKLKGISVLMVNYNGAAYLNKCIQSLYDTLHQAAIPFEILLIDNASTDISEQILKQLAEKYNQNDHQLHLFWSEKNLGFSAANNELAKHAKYESLMLLNNDTQVLQLDQLIQIYKQHGLDSKTVYTGTLLNPDLSQQKNGFNYPNLKSIAAGLWLIKPVILPLVKLLKGSKKSSYDYYSGCYLVMASKLFQELGGFDEQFYFYHEECDLFLRMEKLGIKKEVLSKDQIIHFGGGGGEVSDFSFIQYYVNLARLLWKHNYANPAQLHTLFSSAFKWRMFLCSLGFHINYSPSGHIYQKQGVPGRNPKEVRSLHQSALIEIQRVIATNHG